MKRELCHATNCFKKRMRASGALIYFIFLFFDIPQILDFYKVLGKSYFFSLLQLSFWDTSVCPSVGQSVSQSVQMSVTPSQKRVPSALYNVQPVYALLWLNRDAIDGKIWDFNFGLDLDETYVF